MSGCGHCEGEGVVEVDLADCQPKTSMLFRAFPTARISDEANMTSPFRAFSAARRLPAESAVVPYETWRRVYFGLLLGAMPNRVLSTRAVTKGMAVVVVVVVVKKRQPRLISFCKSLS